MAYYHQDVYKNEQCPTFDSQDQRSNKMETESKSASHHSKNLFFVNVKSVSTKEVNLSTKRHRHILKGQSKNDKLLKKLL